MSFLVLWPTSLVWSWILWLLLLLSTVLILLMPDRMFMARMDVGRIKSIHTTDRTLGPSPTMWWWGPWSVLLLQTTRIWTSESTRMIGWMDINWWDFFPMDVPPPGPEAYPDLLAYDFGQTRSRHKLTSERHCLPVGLWYIAAARSWGYHGISCLYRT